MVLLIIRIYRFVFARECFYLLNKLLYRLSLSGLGILNYESAKVSGEVSFLKNYFMNRPGGVVLDVGANIGKYSQLVRNYNDYADIYAFEPHPKTFQQLKSFLSGVNRLHLFNLAVGDEAGFMSLYDYENKDGSSHASLYKDVIENIHKSKAVEHKAEVISLDDFFKKNQINNVSLLKVDTEGNELNVLMGASEYIKSGKIKAIHFEFNEMNVASRTYFRDFWNLLGNYDFYRLLPNGMVRIDKYSPIFCEIFAFQNIIALLKEESVG